MNRRLLLALSILLLCLTVVGCGGGGRGSVGAPVVSNAPFIPTSFGAPPPGSPSVGDVLYTNSGQWSGSPTGFTYLWEDCNSGGGSCTTAAGSPTNTTRYQVASGDIGFTIRVAVTAAYSGHPSSTVQSAATAVVGSGEFPLAVSGNGRYLVQANSQPFLMVGDSPQSVIGNLTRAQADAYFTDRVSEGFNTVWINLLCADYTACNANGKSLDGSGTAPFTSGTSPSNYNIADPSSTYFAAAHQIVADAQADGLEVVLDPAETGGWEGFLESNGNSSTGATNPDYTYGAFLGTTFGDLKNIIWMSGNDFADVGQQFVDADVQAVANGIQSTDPSALQSLEINIPSPIDGIGTTSLDDTSNDWTGVLTMNGSYIYGPTYAGLLHARGQTPAMPTFLAEANYEGQDLDGHAGGTLQNIRLQAWWTMTTGTTGGLYGGPCYGITGSTSLTSCDTAGASVMARQESLLSGLEWYNLVPDTGNTFVTAGKGTESTSGDMDSSNWVTAALTPDDTLGMAFCPQTCSITVALSKMAGSTVARWYDPSNGSFTPISGSPFTNSGTHTFSDPGNNSAGDTDWVLLLQG